MFINNTTNCNFFQDKLFCGCAERINCAEFFNTGQEVVPYEYTTATYFLIGATSVFACGFTAKIQ